MKTRKDFTGQSLSKKFYERGEVIDAVWEVLKRAGQPHSVECLGAKGETCTCGLEAVARELRRTGNDMKGGGSDEDSLLFIRSQGTSTYPCRYSLRTLPLG